MRRGLGRSGFAARASWLLLAVGLSAACATAPITGRSQLMLVSQGEVNSLGDKAYQDTLAKSKVVSGTPQAREVQQVGRRLAAVAPKEGYQWRFSLVQNDQANAFSLPGGGVVVYTGIFKYARTPAELATVLAHEMGHDMANHGAERMSQELLTQLGASGLQAALGSQSPTATQALLTAYGAGAQVGVLLPFNRTQESEADHIGLVLMAKAGYDPRASLQFWQAMMAGASQQQQPPELLSTHPADQKRIADLRQELPEALAYYHPGQAAPVQPAAPAGQGGWVFGPPQ